MTELRRVKPLLGTYVEIGLPSTPTAIAISELAFAQIKKIHDLLSFHDSESELSRLNLFPNQIHKISHETYHVMRLAFAVAKSSNGIFNPIIGGALVNNNILPNHGFKYYKKVGDWRDIKINNNYIGNYSDGLICLDGIAKGFAVDLAIKTLMQNGVAYGWVNAGGDLRVFGNKTLPITLRKANGEMQEIGGLQNKAIATSCVFETPNQNFKSWIVGENRNLGEFSIISNSAWRADALTKIAANVEANQRNEIIQKLGGFLIEV